MFAGHNRITSMSGCLALSAAIASVLHGGVTLAADAPASGLQEIIVTAQRQQTSLQETPVSITQFSADALKERGITSMLEISSFTPNLQVGSRSGAAGNSGGYAIRGVGVNATGSSPSVGIYIDDVYFNSGVGNLLGLFDVERVEVLRGPQGTLFGRNTIGGAIQYITVRPDTKEVSGFVEGTGGNFGRVDFAAGLNIPLGDTVAVRLTGASRERDGFVHDDLNNVDRGSDDTKQGRVQLRWAPTDNLTIDLKGEKVKQETNGRAVTVIGVNPNSFLVGLAKRGQNPPSNNETAPYDDRWISTGNYQLHGNNQPEFFEFEYSVGAATIAYEFNNSLTLTSISAFSESDRNSAQNIDNVPVSIIAVTNVDATELFTQELRLTGTGDRFNWTTGVYFYDETATASGTANIGLGPTGPFGVANEIKSEAYAIYAQGTYDLTDRWSATLGVRYSSEQIDARATQPYVVNGPPIPGFNLQPSASDTYEDTSPYFGLNFQVTPDVMTYLKASKGFRAGGFNFANPPAGLVPFKQETSWTYELGARMEFLENRLRINPTLFYNEWKDIQFNALAPPSNIFTKNAGDAEIKGGELEMQFAATDRWLLEGSVSFLDGEYTRIDPDVTMIAYYPNGSFNGPGPGPGVPSFQVDLALEDDLQQAPEMKYTAGVRYTLPFSNDARIVANANYAWVDTIRSAVTRSNFVQLPSYSIVNAQVQYIAPDNRWSLAVFGTNLTDEYYRIGGINFGTLGPGSIEVDPARPREYGATLRFNF